LRVEDVGVGFVFWREEDESIEGWVSFADELENEWKQGSWLVLIDITMLNYQLVLLLLPPFTT
jgi:hypothetical protein